MTRRRLTSEEIDMWLRVVEKAERLHADQKSQPPLPKPTPAKAPSPRTGPFAIGQRSAPKPEKLDLKPAVGTEFAAGSVRMDQKAFARLKRGKLKPQARLDLHGMTLDRAHPALTRFILSSQAAGRRLVLVITGKGRDRDDTGPIPAPRGILKRQVPQWLAAPPLAQAVLQVAPAHFSHGGDGALYVYLRKSR